MSIQLTYLKQIIHTSILGIVTVKGTLNIIHESYVNLKSGRKQMGSS